MANKRAFPVALSGKQKEYVEGIRYTFSTIYDYLEAVERDVGRSRELSLSLTKLDESLMWANKAIAEHGDALEGEV